MNTNTDNLTDEMVAASRVEFVRIRLEARELAILLHHTEGDPDDVAVDVDATILRYIPKVVDRRNARRFRFYTGCARVWGNAEKEANFPGSIPTPLDWVAAAVATLHQIQNTLANL